MPNHHSTGWRLWLRAAYAQSDIANQTKMGAANLAVVLGPALQPPELLGRQTKEQAAQQLLAAGQQNALAKFPIENAATLFENA